MIFFVSYLGRHGGGAEYSYEMTKGLLANHKDVYAVISAQVDNLDLWKKLPLKKLILVPTSDHYKGFFSGTLRFIFKNIREIRKAIGKEKIDVFYCPMGHPWTTIARFLIPHKCSVYTLHDPIYHPGTPLLIKLAGKIERLKSIDSYVILSKTFVDYTKKHYGKSDKDIVVIPHGAFSHYDVYSNDIKPFFSLAKYNFLFFGRITKYKGLELLIEAYRKLAKERDDISLRVIGSGDISEYKRDLEACPNTIVENRYVCDNEVHSFFSMPNTITVIPYTSATQSGVIPIAMHEKSLIISTNNEGLMEQTKDGTLALVADISVDSFYKQMKKSVEQYDECQTYIEEAKAYIDSLSWDNLAKILLDHCENILVGNEDKSIYR